MAQSLLSERYELVDHIGSGGMATVWRGRDLRLEREVASKILSEQLASDPAFRARFEREARHVASLKHPNVVTVHDYGNEGGTSYLVMELIEGESLQCRLDATAPYLDLDVSVRLTREALAGLSHAHLKGIIHRDVKPANILITREETAKLADFGIARAVDEVTGLTTTGSFIGTPSYSAPEQLSGNPATPATDIYALGCVLYECLTGRPPFEAEVFAGVVAQQLKDTPRPPREYRSEIPAGVESVVLRALEKAPEHRFASAKEMDWALTERTDSVGPRATKPTRVVEPPPGRESVQADGRSRDRRRSLVVLALVGVAAIAGAAVAIPLLLLGASGSSRPTTPTTSVAATTPTTKAPTTTSPTTSAQPAGGAPTGAFVINTTADVWLKTGPGSSFGNVVVAPDGASVSVTCFVANGQPDTDPAGSTSTFWFRTFYNGFVGWVSNNYLNARPAAAAPAC